MNIIEIIKEHVRAQDKYYTLVIREGGGITAIEEGYEDEFAEEKRLDDKMRAEDMNQA